MTTLETTPPGILRLGKIATVLGALAGVIFLGAAWMMHEEKLFWEAYFFGWLIWTCYGIGCFGLMLLQTVIRSNWGYPVMRLFEAGAKTLPIMFLLFLPLALRGAYFLYPWADAAMVLKDPILQHRSGMMNVPAFAIRGCIYFGFWTFYTVILTRYTKLQDETKNEALAQFRTNMAAFGMLVHGIMVTFAFLDWVMSLEPDWYSTIFGVWFIIGMSLSAMGLVTVIGAKGYAANRAPWTKEIVTDSVRKDWGNMLLMMTMVWAYFSLSQWLIMWNGNLPQEIVFYIKRFQGVWLYVGAFIVVFQFFVPFLALLSGKTKRYPNLLSTVATWLMFMRLVDLTWHVLPIFHGGSMTIILLAYTAVFAFGGLWLALFVNFFKSNALVQAPQFINGYREVSTHA